MHSTSSLKFLLIYCFIAAGLAGCNDDDTTQESRYSLLQTTNPEPAAVDSEDMKERELAERIRDTVLSLDEIYDVAIVKGKNDILVAYKVKHMQRFRMKDIEKRLNKMLEKKYPKEDFTVSSDYKIFLEAVELKESITDNKDYPEKEAEKRLQKIIKLKKELT